MAPGVVLLHPDHTLAAITGEAEHLLADVADHSSRAGRLPAAFSRSRVPADVDRGTALSDASPTVRVRTMSGRLLLVHATHLHRAVDDDIAVIIGAATRAAPRTSFQLARTDTAEAEVALLGCEGHPLRRWSRTAPVQVHVKDHLKSIFVRLGFEAGVILSPSS